MGDMVVAKHLNFEKSANIST